MFQGQRDDSNERQFKLSTVTNKLSRVVDLVISDDFGSKLLKQWTIT